MNHYLALFRFNNKKSEKSLKNTKMRNNIVPLLLISLLLISLPVTFFSTIIYAQEGHVEADFETILNDTLGFTNISLSTIETFPAGKYQAILYAELAGYSETNVLRYYPVLTDDFQTIFPGPVGAPYGSDGYITPPYPSTIFVVEETFGLSLLASGEFFTEHWRNTDYPEQHAKIYANLDSPNMFLIGFEDQLGGDDRDYNDMVFSLTQIVSPIIVSVSRSPENPVSDQAVTVTAEVIEGNAEIESVILSYKAGSSSWTNVTMSLNGESYIANIPGQSVNTQVTYKIYASDVDGNTGVSQTDSYVIFLVNKSPIAIFTYSPAVVRTDEVVEFDASSSYDPDGTIESYSWDFGDGNTATGAAVSHSFIENGEYLVSLAITDNEGLIGGKVATQIVNNRPPVAAFVVSESIVKNEEVVFDATSSYDSDGTVISYTWSFGDGTVAVGVTATHSFVNTGLYSVTLAIDDNDGAIDQQKLTIFVTEPIIDQTNKRPVASFTAIPKIVSIDEKVYFDASESVDSDGSIATYLWDFGDNNTATGVTTEHAYSGKGTYIVILTVTDNNGVMDIDSHAVSVTIQATPNQNPVASFIKSTQTTSRGETIQFDATESYDTDSIIASYTWDFGDGNTATGTEVDHTYTNIGIYTITLTVTDSEGLTSQTTSAITITNAIPTASFTKSAETVKVDEIIYFDASESVDSDGSIATYLWDFGDGNTSTEIATNHVYSEEGTYKVTLTVTDNDNELSSTFANISVLSEPASFDMLSAIGIGIVALAAIILIVLLARRRSN